jgi:Pentapeptide repeats (8 copies)
MRRMLSWPVLVSGSVLVLLLVIAVVFLPAVVYPGLTAAGLHGVASVSTRVDLQNARFALQNDFRGQLIQILAALIVIAGAVATWQQIQVAREGQITDRFTRAIDHLGSSTLDIRIGGIYALERLALNSPSDRASVTRILTAFVREHSPWLVGSPGGPVHPTPEVDDQLPWLSNRANDVQAAMHVLARRPVHPDEPRLLLTRTDLRGIYLPDARLDEAFLRRANLARAWMPGIHLERSEMGDTDLRRAKLRGAYMSQADLRDAHLQHADLRHAVLRGADLRGADLTGALLEGADLADVKTDDTTVWPMGYPNAPHAEKP